jgi:hypothetical protein
MSLHDRLRKAFSDLERRVDQHVDLGSAVTRLRAGKRRPEVLRPLLAAAAAVIITLGLVALLPLQDREAAGPVTSPPRPTVPATEPADTAPSSTAPSSTAVAVTGTPPARWVGVGGDGHSVTLIDAGEPTELVAVPDGAECPEVSAACRSADGINLAGDTLFYSVCCEPAPGQYFSHVIGSDPSGGQSRIGQLTDVDAAGYQLVVNLSMPLAQEFSPAGGEVRSFDVGDAGWRAYDGAWSADRAVVALAATRVGDDLAVDSHVVYGFRSDEAGAGGTVVAETERDESFDGLVIDAQGRLWYVLQHNSGPAAETVQGVVADPMTGEAIEEFDYGGNVVDQNIDASGQFLIITFDDGSVHWRSIDGHQTGVLAEPGSGYIAADW